MPSSKNKLKVDSKDNHREEKRKIPIYTKK